MNSLVVLVSLFFWLHAFLSKSLAGQLSLPYMLKITRPTLGFPLVQLRLNFIIVQRFLVFDKNKNTLMTPVCHLQVTEKKKKTWLTCCQVQFHTLFFRDHQTFCWDQWITKMSQKSVSLESILKAILHRFLQVQNDCRLSDNTDVGREQMLSRSSKSKIQTVLKLFASISTWLKRYSFLS